MELERVLLALEEEGWNALSGPNGAAYYREHMAGDGLMVFPGMVLDKEATVQAIAQAEPWSWFRIEEPRAVLLGQDAGVLTYRAAARRSGGPVYRALMSSVYVRRGGVWLLALHQQTPLEG